MRNLHIQPRRLILALTACVLVAAIGLSAYFTAETDVIENTFTVGSGVHIQLEEPSWVPEVPLSGDNYQTLVSNYTKAKDPKISLTASSVPSYVFMELTIPCLQSKNAFTTLVTEAGSTSTQVDGLGYINSKWALVGSNPFTSPTGSGTTAVFAYVGDSGSTMARLSSGECTTALFDHVRFANYTADELYNAVHIQTYQPVKKDGSGNVKLYKNSDVNYEVTWNSTTGTYQYNSTDLTADELEHLGPVVDQSAAPTIVIPAAEITALTAEQKTDLATHIGYALTATNVQSTFPSGEDERLYAHTSEVLMYPKAVDGSVLDTASIGIKAYAIQADHLYTQSALNSGGSTKDLTPAAVWALVSPT